jgi:hypothetical protein
MICIQFLSCQRQDNWLDVKSNKKAVVPTSLKDFQAILDDYYYINDAFPGIGLVGTDNYYLTDNNYNVAKQTERNAFLWKKDIYEGAQSSDWNSAYLVVEYANIVLDGLSKINISADNRAEYNNIKGSALFYRAFMFYSLAQIFCKPFDSSASLSDLGIPIRLSSDINKKSIRATVSQTYKRIIMDLDSASRLLPQTPKFNTRPGKISANALLAKVYLSMGIYKDAGIYANKVLNNYSVLLDYNSDIISPSSTFRFPPYPNNPEIIFYAYQHGYSPTWPYGVGYVDSVLYASYDNNDLRKSLYYAPHGNGGIVFAGTYTGSFYNFCGIATNELYLIRAECYARQGQTQKALADLNTLLVKRYRTGTFTPLSATTPEDALKLVLTERRKELPFTGQLRWEDLRRLNKDPKFRVTLKRVINGVTYTLPPNDDRYTYPIPDNEIQLTGMPQNHR